MIQIESIHIQNFRGIRQLNLTLDRKSFGICGPNGTGKSGVVDSIEFALTGNITRLTGKGTSAVSVKEHGAHVDFRNNPDKSFVKLSVFVPLLNKSFTIERRIKNPSKPIVEPANDLEINALVLVLKEHPEFALSRREILKYVITEEGQRAKEVQALLKLDEVEKLRSSLQSVANECKRSVESAENEVNQARGQLLSALKIEEISVPALLIAVNERRTVLGLESLVSLGPDTSIKGDLGAKKPESGTRPVNKATATTDLNRLRKAFQSTEDENQKKCREELRDFLNKLKGDARLIKNLQKRDFLSTGLELLDADDPFCPLCDTEWDIAKLRGIVQDKLRIGKEAAELKSRIEEAARPVKKSVSEFTGLIKSLRSHSTILGLHETADELEKWEANLTSFSTALTATGSIDDSVERLAKDWRQPSEDIVSHLDKVDAEIKKLPDASMEDEAREYLAVGQERLETYRQKQRLLKMWKDKHGLATRVQKAFEDSSNAVLSGLYNDVEKEFSRYYAFINKADEADFSSKLTPSLGKLGFEVEFYGRGMFPPGAYHSEGHQDGMGLCLYLTLMRRILDKEFRFAVLDDVLMSVDTGHRKEVCRLLKQEFPNTQFIFTTHDPVWLKHMIGEAMVTSKAVLEFRKWTVDDGPQVWNFADVWQEISSDLNANNVPGAAHSLRRFLEYISNDLSSRLRAQVEFRDSHNYDLGDLLFPVIGRFSKLLESAQKAEQSWNNDSKVAELKVLRERFSKCIQGQQGTQWMINPNVHYNEWANFSREDFEPVVEAFKELIECFKCKACNTFLYVVPSRGPQETLRCDCNATNFNLKKKEAEKTEYAG